MQFRRRSAKLLAVLAGISLLAAACGDDDEGGSTATTAGTGTEETTTSAAPDGEGVEGGTLIWAHEQEPPDLHLDDPNNNLSITSWLWQGMWDGLYGVSADVVYVPELLTEDPPVVENGDGSVTVDFTLRDGLTWSDGEPLTANDVKFEFDVIMETGPDGDDEDTDEDFVYLIGDRTGYDTITDFTVNSDTEFSITWSAFFAGWKGLFSNVFPAHAFGDGAGAAEVNAALPEWTNAAGEVLPSSGPLVFDSWERGVAMNFVRNEVYHGSVSPDVENTGIAHVDGLRVNWVADTDTQINSLKSGEAHMIYTQPQIAFGDNISTDDAFTVASLAGPVFEHWGFNVLNPHLAKPEVREAIALAFDKSAVVTTLYSPLFGDLLPESGLGNTYWLSNQPEYEDHQGDAGYGLGDIEGAAAKLESVGYVLGDDGVYAHPTDGRLSLRVGTTGGNALRELQEQLIQEAVAPAGIEITIDNVPGGDFFSERIFSEQALLAANTGGAEGDPTIWDITQFAWVGGPWPGGQSASYRTASGNNGYGYASADFDALSDECDATIDDAERGACYNELDKYVTTLEVDPNGLIVIPITQKPSFYACNTDVLVRCAVSADANTAGPLSNVVDFQFLA